MPDSPRDYDKEYTKALTHRLRIQQAYSHEKGDVTRFVVQLEYRVDDSWCEVVRYDHDPASEHAHDVEEEGLHMDIYRGGEKHRTEFVAPPMPGASRSTTPTTT
ncbi:MAG: hypothetical protein ABEJ30_06685 [Halorientalis sp.]